MEAESILIGCAVLLISIVWMLGYQRQVLLLQKQHLPGPSFIWPILGSVVQMVLHPYEFYEEQKKYGPISWNIIVNKLFIYTRDPSLSKKIFANEQGKLRLWLHMNAEKILGSNNIAFMHGDPHKALRKELLQLFTKKELSKYLSIQETEIRNHIDKWKNASWFGNPIEVRLLARDLNVDTSVSVFIGPYISKPGREEFRKDFLLMNEGLLAFPLNIPGTTLYKAIQARKRIINMLIPMIQSSQIRMYKERCVPECLLDEWMILVMKKPIEERESEVDYGFHVLDFLFAAQDASTSSLVWVFELLSKYPENLEQIKLEQFKLRPHDDPIRLQELDMMEHTNQFVKELLRYSAPAVSVPHIAVEDFQLTSDFIVKKGTILFPSIMWAHTTDEGFHEWYKFDPSRWNAERREESNKCFLTFGMGPHKCLGQEYAQNHLKCFVSILVSKLEWTRIQTPKCKEIEYFPTITPADGCLISMSATK